MKILETHIVPVIYEKIRLQEYAFSVFNNIPTRSALKKIIKKKLLLIDGKPADTGHWIQSGEKIELLEAQLPSRKIFKLDFEVLYEDDYLAVVHKPAGYPTNGNYFRTIENALPHNLKRSEQPDALAYPEPVHRLDNPTAGILLVAKTRNSRSKLHKDFSEKRIQKAYFALVHGFLKEDISLQEPIDGKPAETLVSLEYLIKIGEEQFSLVKAIPKTGRTHQIRIHLSSLGHQIVGESRYKHQDEIFFKNKSLYLFAGEIRFLHPVLDKKMSFDIPLPKRFRNLVQYKVR